jgi:hypothetical protein
MTRHDGGLAHDLIATLAGEWLRCMRRGDFAGAWSAADRLVRAGAVPRGLDVARHHRSVWDGAPIDGARVLIRCFRGLGDTIQFVRFVPEVRRRAASVLLMTQPSLIPLLGTVPQIGQIAPECDCAAPVPPHDVALEITELAHACRASADALPAVPYLHVPPAALPRRGRLRVGLVWRGGESLPGRSAPLAALAPLTGAAVDWYVLQGGPGLAERPPTFGTLAGNHDMLDAARTVAALDLVITVDSMPAHLAGALGTPVWVLLKHDADWRWMAGRDDSPWYPSMRLFRQHVEGDWTGLATRVREALDPVARRTPAPG